MVLVSSLGPACIESCGQTWSKHKFNSSCRGACARGGANQLAHHIRLSRLSMPHSTDAKRCLLGWRLVPLMPKRLHRNIIHVFFFWLFRHKPLLLPVFSVFRVQALAGGVQSSSGQGADVCITNSGTVLMSTCTWRPVGQNTSKTQTKSTPDL